MLSSILSWKCVTPRSAPLIALLLVLLPRSAHADGRATGGDEPAAYRAAVATAIEEFDLNHFSEAREQFVHAHALFPNARTLRGMGLCDFELRRYVAAVGYLREALASDVKRLEGKLRSATETILERALSYVGTVRLQVEPAHATVSVDGINLEPSTAADLLIEVGDHALVVRAAGHVTERRQLQVHGEQDETIQIQLAPLELAPERVAGAAAAAPTAAAAPEPAPPAAKTPIYKRWWLWTAVGVVLAGAAAGTAVALTSDKSTQYEPTTGANTPPGVSLQPLGVRP